MSRPTKRGIKTSWTSTAFMVEVLVLLFFLVASMAVFTQLFAAAVINSSEATRLSQATVLAQNAAEEFSADPTAAKAENGTTEATDGPQGLKVTSKVTSKATKAGTLYTAHITVSDSESDVYQLDVQRYVEGNTK